MSCRKLIEYVTKNSSPTKIYLGRILFVHLFFLFELERVIFIIVKAMKRTIFNFKPQITLQNRW